MILRIGDQERNQSLFELLDIIGRAKETGADPITGADFWQALEVFNRLEPLVNPVMSEDEALRVYSEAFEG